MAGYTPNVASKLDGSGATYIGPDPDQPGQSIIENECGDRFTWADDEFSFIGYTPFGLTQLDLNRAHNIAASAHGGTATEGETVEKIVEAMAALVKDRDDVFRVVMARNMGDPVPTDIAEDVVRIADEIVAAADAEVRPVDGSDFARKGLPIL